MASDIAYSRPLPPPPPVSVSQEIDPEETIILRQVEMARRRIAMVELTWRILVLVAGAIFFAILAAVFDQWIFPKGMPNAIRWSLWAVFVAASLAWAIISVGPYLIRRIHPVFAAYVVEQAVPSLKHGLISFLTLRNAKDQFQADPIRKNVFRGLEATTANTVAKVPVEAVVDRSQIIRAGYVLIVLVALFCLYIVFSPKDPFRSFARALFPWSRLSPPTRVRIDDVRPGTKGIIEGERVVVSANVRGLRNGEEVKVLYSTADGQAVNQLIPMSRDRENGDLFACELSQSFQQETVYRILAGDASTEEYRLHVVIPLRLRIRSIEYLFPRYTGLAPRVTEDLGDIRAVEGTQIKMTVESDVPLSSAEMVMEKAQIVSVPMVVKNQEAFARTTLRLSKPEGRERELGTYFIRGESADGRPSVDPVKYTIEIIPDQPPQGTWLEPSQEEVGVPVDGTLALRIQAQDPDFGLRQVALEIEAGGSKLVKQLLLDKPAGESHSGEFLGEYLLVPKSLNLAVGDVAICRVTLVDNREPTPNRTELPVRRIRIVDQNTPATSQDRQAPASSQQAQDQRAQTEPKAQENRQTPSENNSRADTGENRQPQPESSSPTQPQRPESSDAQPSKPSQQNTTEQPGQSGPQENQSGQSGSSAAPEKGTAGPESQKNSGAENSSQQASESSSGQSKKPEPASNQTSPQAAENQTRTQSQTDSSQGGDPSQRTQTPSGQSGQGEDQSQSPQTTASQQSGRENTGENQQTMPGQQSGEREDGSQQSGNQRATTPETQKGSEPRQGMPATQSPQTGGQQGKEPSAQNQPSTGNSGNQSSNAGEQQGGPSGPEKGASGAGQTEKTQREGNQGLNDGSTSSGTNQTTGNDSSSGQENSNNSSSRPGAGATSQGAAADQGSSQKGSSPSEKVDGITNPGEAVERILSYLEKKGIDPSQLAQGSKETGKEASSQGEKGKTGETPSQEENALPRSPGGPGERIDDPQKTPGQGTEDRPGASSDTPMASQPSGENREGAGNQTKPETAPPVGTTPSSGSPSDRNQTTQTPGEPPAAAQPQASQQTNPQSPQGIAGDQAGMGGRGGGQQTPQPGEGTPGSQTPTDSQEGAPVASPGGQEAGQSTGASGSSTQSGTNDQNSGGSPQGGETSQNAGTSGQAGQSRTGSSSRMENGGTSEGGMPGGTRGPGSGSPVVDTPVDDPNLEYARRQTELVLRYLENELAKQEPDKELLGQLGWSPQEVAEFVRRWKELKQAAQEPSPKGKTAQKQLNEILKSLGLKPKTSTIKGSQQNQDELRGMDAGRDVPPPPQWSEYFQAYLRSLGASP